MLSVYVVCWIFLQTFQTYFCIQANSVDPDQTAPLSGSTLFAKNDFLNHKQMTRQTTIVVIGGLRVYKAVYNYGLCCIRTRLNMCWLHILS